MTTTTDDTPPPAETQAERSAPPRSRLTRSQRSRVVWAIVVASAVAGVWAGLHPTDIAVADVVLVGGFAALVPWCSAHARRWTWCWMAGVAGVAGVALLVPLLLAGAALIVSLAATRARRRRRIDGAVIGALAVQALLRLGDLGVVGASAAVVAIAVTPVLMSGYRHMPRRQRTWLRRGLVGAVVLAVVGVASAGAAVLSIRGGLVSAIDRSDNAVAHVGEGQQEATLADLTEASDDFASASDLLDSPLLWPARSLPVVGPHVGALRELSATGEDLTSTASQTLGEVDYDRLRYESGRINLAEVEAVAPALREIRVALVTAEQRSAALDSPWLIAPLTDRVDDLRAKIVSTRKQADTAETALDLAPEMLGSEGPRRYLVVFPTEAETRGGGGFVGNFVILDAVDGKVTMAESSRIKEMINAREPGERTLEGLDEYVDQYGEFRPQDFNQDILASPHFPSNADAFAQVATQSGRGEIDAVVSVSPAGLGALMTLTGPVRIPGRAEALRPAEAEDFLLVGQYLTYANSDGRAEALESLTQQVFDRLTSGTLPSPRRMGAVLSPLVPTGGLRVWSTRPGEQDLLRELGVTGELEEAGGHDLVRVSAVNGGQNKIDVFLHRKIEVEPTIDPETGEVVSTVRVTLRNEAPGAGLPPYVIGNAQGDPVGTNRHLLSVFTPLGLERATVDGVEVGVDAGSERGYNIYGRYLEVPPGESMVFELHLRGTIEGMDDYRLVVPAQAMVNPDILVVRGPLVGEERALVSDRTRVVRAEPG